jgi:methylmalonic aciduria homocystinuria type C protein
MFDAAVRRFSADEFDPTPPSLESEPPAADTAAIAPARESAAAQLCSHLRLFGFDLIQPFAVGWYNDAVEEPLRLPDFGDSGRLGLLVGNSRALWPVFVDALREDPTLLEARNPIETYVMRVVDAGVRGLPVRSSARWAHSIGRDMVAMQRLAEISGLAALAPANLSVHPQFGPWIALRAAVVLDLPGPVERPHMPLACDACQRGCLPAFQRARASWLGSATSDNGWRLWLAVRDGCPLGREHRYCDEQIAYHYTKDPQILRAALRAAE